MFVGKYVTGARRPRRPSRSGTVPTASTPTSRSRPTSACRRSWPAPIPRAPPRLVRCAGPRSAARSATGRAAASTTSPTTSGRCRPATRRSATTSIPRSGFLPRRATAVPSSAPSSSRSRRTSRGSGASRRTTPTTSFYGFDDKLQSSNMHMHPFEIQPRQGGRFGWFVDRVPGQPDDAVRGLQPRRQARRRAAGRVHVVSERAGVLPQPQRRGHRHGPLPAGQVLRRRLQLARAEQRLPLRRQDHGQRRLDPPGRRPARRIVRHPPHPGQGELLVHDAGQPVRRWSSTTARRRSSRRTSGWRSSTAAAPACSWSTTTAATRPASRRSRRWAGRS